MRGVVQEALVLFRGAEAHHRLDPGSIVPGAVEEDDFTGGGQVRGVTLEIPLRQFAIVRLGQGDDAGLARGHELGHALDRPVLAGGVAALEDDHDLQPLLDGPGLGLDQLNLQGFQGVVVVVLGHSRALLAVARVEACDHFSEGASPCRLCGEGERSLFGINQAGRMGVSLYS
ncbi:hypothetical protein D3C81_1437810 [compost metagenome]